MQANRIVLADLNDAPYNPRRISVEALAALVASVREFTATVEGRDDGFRLATTITVNRQGNRIVGGHQRVQALRTLDQDWIAAADVTWVDIPPDSAIEKALNLTLNNPRNQGKFTEDAVKLLAEVAAEIPDMTAALDLDGLLADLRALTDGLLQEDKTDPDAVPEIPAEPVSTRGDLWLLGDHRLLCGDCTVKEDVERVMEGDCETLIYDPEWDAAPPMTPLRHTLAFTDGGCIGDVVRLFGAPTWLFAWDCVTSWYTPNRPLRRGKLAAWYGPIDEYDSDGAHYGDSGEEREVKNTRGSYTFKPDPRGKHLSDVFQVPITRLHADGEHEHSKPVDWIRMLIGNCTRGDIYDPFLGSGTTLIAAEQLNRRCYAIEIEPRYVDVAVRRWEAFTGKKATLGGV